MKDYKFKSLCKGSMKKIVFLFIFTFISPNFGMEQSKEEALFNAIERNDLATTKKLIESGVKINIRDKNGDTPLILAVKQKNIDVIKTILNELPNLDLENKEKKVAIEVAQALSEESASAKILKNNIIDLLKLAEIQNDFDYAVREGRLDLNNIARLINAGASVNIPTDERFPLVSAIKNGELKLIKLLIQHGADVNQRLKNGKTPLMYAADEKHYPISIPEIIKILLEKGANPNVAEPKNHFTPLMYAVFDGGDIDAIQLLIKAGANRSMKDWNERIALYHAKKYLDEAKNNLANASTTGTAKQRYQEEKKNYEIITDLLIGEKISTDRENLLKALQEVDVNALKKLIPEFWGLRSAFTLAREYNYLAGMNAILNTFSSDLNKQNKEGDTTLMLIFNDAIRDNELSAVNLLINYGVDVNKADNVGKTPLMVAAEYSTPAIVQLLLQRGANPNAVGGYSKWAPLIYAIEEGNFDVIEPLLNGKADPLIKNERGKDVLDIAKMALNQASREAVRGRRFQQKKQNYEKIVKLIESKIPPAILEQKREQERQKQAAKEQARQQEAARLAQEEANRQEQERQRQAQAERDRLTREAEETRKIEERLRQEQLTRERLERERLEQQKRQQEREQERLRAAQERLERERLAASDKLLLSALHNLTQTFNQIQRFL